MSNRKPIHEIEVELTNKRSLIKVSAIVCNVNPVRELETEYRKYRLSASKQIKRVVDDYAELEKKLEIAVGLLNEWDNDYDPNMCLSKCDCAWCKTRRYLTSDITGDES